MFVALEEVLQLTGRDIDSVEILMGAQAIIETYVGRTEADVTNPRDRALLARAVAYQAVFMETQSQMVYTQVFMKSITVGGVTYNFPDSATEHLWLAPLAKAACEKLSWTRSRSITTGKSEAYASPRLLDWWTED